MNHICVSTKGEGIVRWIADWQLARQASEDTITKVLDTDIDKTALEVWTMADVMAGTFEFTGGTGPKTITNAQLVAALGSETDFNPASSQSRYRGGLRRPGLRAWFVRSGHNIPRSGS